MELPWPNPLPIEPIAVPPSPAEPSPDIPLAVTQEQHALEALIASESRVSQLQNQLSETHLTMRTMHQTMLQMQEAIATMELRVATPAQPVLPGFAPLQTPQTSSPRAEPAIDASPLSQGIGMVQTPIIAQIVDGPDATPTHGSTRVSQTNPAPAIGQQPPADHLVRPVPPSEVAPDGVIIIQEAAPPPILPQETAANGKPAIVPVPTTHPTALVVPATNIPAGMLVPHCPDGPLVPPGDPADYDIIAHQLPLRCESTPSQIPDPPTMPGAQPHPTAPNPASGPDAQLILARDGPTNPGNMMTWDAADLQAYLKSYINMDGARYLWGKKVNGERWAMVVDDNATNLFERLAIFDDFDRMELKVEAHAKKIR